MNDKITNRELVKLIKNKLKDYWVNEAKLPMAVRLKSLALIDLAVYDTFTLEELLNMKVKQLTPNEVIIARELFLLLDRPCEQCEGTMNKECVERQRWNKPTLCSILDGMITIIARDVHDRTSK